MAFQRTKAFFERAAQLGGYKDLTDFVIVAVQEKAKAIISGRERTITSKKDSEIFFNTVLNSKAPNKELSNATDEFNALFAW